MLEAGRRLTRQQFGVLDGFLYERKAGESPGWTGFFCGQGRWLHIVFALARERHQEIDAGIAISVLQSFQVKQDTAGGPT